MTLFMLPKIQTVRDYRWLLFGQPMMMMMMTVNGYLLNLEIDLVLEMVADTGQDIIECVV